MVRETVSSCYRTLLTPAFPSGQACGLLGEERPVMEIDLSNLNEHSESETLELKESFDSKALETIGAFANSDGGTILIGVRDDGRIIGVNLGSKTLEEWAQKMQLKIQPRFLPSLRKRIFQKRTVVEINVERSNTPITVDGRFVKRVGRTNQMMGPDEIKQRLFASSGMSWDAQLVEDATIEDLDPQAIAQFISLVKTAGRRPLGGSSTEVLEKLEIVHQGKPTRAAILLMGGSPAKFFLSAFIQLGRFKSPTRIVDSKHLDGNILEQIQEGMIWFEQRLETEFIITGQPTREEKWEYPLPAIREALINAVCHREYNAVASTQVRLYDDRLEIWNPGGLLLPLTPGRLLEEHPSLPRNRLLANCLFYAGFIESWGGGTLRIADLMKQADLGVPEFISTSGEFRIVLRKQLWTESDLEKEGLNTRQVSAVLHTMKVGRITNREYQDYCSVSKATAARELADLVQQGIFLRHGTTGKYTFYTVSRGSPTSH